MRIKVSEMLISYPDSKDNLQTYKIENFLLLPRGIVREYGAAAGMVAGALIRFAGKNKKCWPKLRTIGEVIGMSPTTTHFVLAPLIKAGLISIKHGWNMRCTYTFIWHPAWEACLPKRAKKPDNLKVGEAFCPHKLFDCTLMHSSCLLYTSPSPRD